VQRLYLVSEIYGAGSSLSVDTDEHVQRVASRASSCTEVDRDALAQPVTEPGMWIGGLPSLSSPFNGGITPGIFFEITGAQRLVLEHFGPQN